MKTRRHSAPSRSLQLEAQLSQAARISSRFPLCSSKTDQRQLSPSAPNTTGPPHSPNQSCRIRPQRPRPHTCWTPCEMLFLVGANPRPPDPPGSRPHLAVLTWPLQLPAATPAPSKMALKRYQRLFREITKSAKTERNLLEMCVNR